MRILLAEDDQILGAGLKRALEQQAYGVDWVRDGRSAADALRTMDFAAAILDINMPQASGLDVLRDLRQARKATPVVLLTARDKSEQKVEGLDQGADDYIVKPFDLNELLARLRALIRRSEGRAEPRLQSGAVTLDAAGGLVEKDGQAVPLTAREFRVLKILMEKAGRYCTKSDIEYALYDADAAVESNTVEVAIYNIRKKLGGDFVRSIRGIGYTVSR